MEDDEKKEKKKYPSLPSNYVTLVQLRERWLDEKKRKQKEKEDKEAEEERQLQKLEEEEEEHKRKLERQGLKEVDGIDQRPTRWNQRRSGRAVEMNIANPIAVDMGKLKTEPEQKREEPNEKKKKKKKKKKKPSEEKEKEVSEGTAQEPHVISEEENARVRRNGESEGRISESRPRRENAERTAEIEQKFGEFSMNGGTEKVDERATRPRTGMHGGNRQYRGCGRFGGRREVVKRSGRAVETNIANPVAVCTGNRTNEPEQKSEEPKEKKKRTRKEKEVSDGTAQAPHVIMEENAPVRRNGESEGRRSEYRPRRENADRTAEIEQNFGEFSMNGGNEIVNERATRPRTRMHGGISEYRGRGRFGDRWKVVKRSSREVGMSIANPVAVDTGNGTIEPGQKSEEPKEKMKQREEMEKEVSDSTAQVPRVISEEENAPLRRNGESDGRRSEYRPRRESADQTAEIEQNFGEFSMNGGTEKVNERATRPRTRMHGGISEYRGCGRFGDRWKLVKRSGREVGMSIGNPVAVDTGNGAIEPEQKSEEPKEKKEEKMKQREEMEKEVSDSTAQALHVISEEENAPVRRKGESDGRRSEYRPRRENADQTVEIEQEFGDFSMNGGNEKVNERVARPRPRPRPGMDGGNREYRGYGRPRPGMDGGNIEYRGYGRFSGCRDVVKQSGASMVWVRKGDLPNGNVGGVQSSIAEPKKLN